MHGLGAAIAHERQPGRRYGTGIEELVIGGQASGLSELLPRGFGVPRFQESAQGESREGLDLWRARRASAVAGPRRQLEGFVDHLA